jgi:hypothetical protein
MQNGVRVYVFCLLFFLILTGSLPAETSNETYYALQVVSIGFPTSEKVEESWGINDLKIFDKKLYIGSGCAVVNTGPTDIISYDLLNGTFVSEFTVDDEAIYKYQVIDGTLIVPGPDATEDWEWGNIYLKTKNGWVKKRTVTHGIHVNHLASYNNKWYVATGNYFDFGEDDLLAFGGILVSEDRGVHGNLCMPHLPITGASFESVH